jgi:hypothetical protein
MEKRKQQSPIYTLTLLQRNDAYVPTYVIVG